MKKHISSLLAMIVVNIFIGIFIGIAIASFERVFQGPNYPPVKCINRSNQNGSYHLEALVFDNSTSSATTMRCKQD